MVRKGSRVQIPKTAPSSIPMHLLKRISQIFIGLIGAVLMLGGVFLIFAGAIDGFGNPAVWSRLVWIVGGLTSLVAGFYVFYVACDRDIGDTLDWIISSILLWP